jgi:hypothetical protein
MKDTLIWYTCTFPLSAWRVYAYTCTVTKWYDQYNIIYNYVACIVLLICVIHALYHSVHGVCMQILLRTDNINTHHICCMHCVYLSSGCPLNASWLSLQCIDFPDQLTVIFNKPCIMDAANLILASRWYRHDTANWIFMLIFVSMEM